MEWVFPNALAESVKRTADRRGQHANRFAVRDPDDKWPALYRVPPTKICPLASVPWRHEAPRIFQSEYKRYFVDPFCRSCGGVVSGG